MTVGAQAGLVREADGGSGGAAAALGGALGFVVGFLPWIVYWILVGNASFVTAVGVALALAVLVNLAALVRHRPPMVLEVGSAAVFACFLVLALTLSDSALERWIQPLGNAGLLAIVLVSVLIGKPFTEQYARQSTPPELWDEPGFVYVCRLLAWVWVGVMAFMALVAVIPPLVDGDATIRDAGDPLSVACYWVLPFAALGLGMLFTTRFPDWFGEAAGDPPREGAPADPLPLDGAGDRGRAGSASLALSPSDALADEPVSVRISGVEPGAPVEVVAETVDAVGHRWRSRASFTASAAGRVDLGTDAPVDGDWSTADASALVWSMGFASDEATPDIYIPSLDPSATSIAATSGRTTLRATLVRRSTGAEVTVHEVRAPGVIGRLFLPAVGGSLPGVVLFPGSEGGLDSQGADAALLAAHGCAALVAATFAGDGPPLDGLGSELARIPLERFGDAITWLASHSRVDDTRVSAMAISRGAEGLLAAASRIEGLPLRLVVGVSPSSLTWVGLGAQGSLAGTPAWTLGGEDLPAVQTDDHALFAAMARQAVVRRGNAARHGPALLHMRVAYAPRLDDAVAEGAAAIVAEDISAPLLLVAGGADEMWPSATMARRLLDRRRRDDDLLLEHPRAGHLIRLGCWPTTVNEVGGIAMGGDAPGLAAAQADVTARVVAAVTGRGPVT